MHDSCLPGTQQADGAADEHQADAPSESFLRGGGSARVRRVLVVDDERLIADTLTRILNLSGFIAQSAYSGDDALDMLSTHCPDIVLTDVRMPGLDGIETGLLIRARCPHIRVVLFSGQAGVGSTVQEVSERSDGFELWQKPIPPRELVERLRRL